VADDLEDLGAVIGAGGDFDEDHFFDHGIAIGVFLAMDHVDEFVHLKDDLGEAFWVPADADGHAAEAGIAGLGDDEGLDVEATAAEHVADAAEDAGLVVHIDAERVDVDDVSLGSRLFVGGGGDAVAHKFGQDCGMFQDLQEDGLKGEFLGMGGALGVEAGMDHLEVGGVAFDTDPLALKFLGGDGGGAGAEEGVDDEIAGVCGAGDEFFDESEGFL